MYWYIFFICGALSISIIIFIFASELIIYFYGFKSEYPIIGTVIGAFIGFISQNKIEDNNLIYAEKYNIKNGLLDIKSGGFDLSKEIMWNTPVKEERVKRNISRLNKLSYFMPLIGLMISRNASEKSGALIISMILFMMAIIVAIGSSRPFSMAVYLSKSEKIIKKPLLFL